MILLFDIVQFVNLTLEFEPFSRSDHEVTNYPGDEADQERKSVRKNAALRRPSHCQRQNERSHGQQRRPTAFTTLKIAVLAPIPNASATTAVMVKPGARDKFRAP